MTAQHAIVAVLTALSLLYLVRCTWQTWTSTSCAGGCGCGKATPPAGGGPKLIAPQELLARVRLTHPIDRKRKA